DPALRAEGQQLGAAAPVEDGVAAGKQEAVDVGLAREAAEQLALVHPDADRADNALVAQLRERGQGLVASLLVAVIRIVHQRDVDAVEPESPEALGQRPERSVAREVEVRLERGPVLKVRLAGPQQSPDLRRDGERLARVVVQRRAQSLLGETGAV